MKFALSLTAAMLATASASKASIIEHAPLSEAVGVLETPIDDLNLERIHLANTALPSKSDIATTLGYQTAVKFQGSRNTCTVFAIVGALEANLRRAQPNLKKVDLSEQWVQYLAALGNASGGAKGSTVATNFSQIKRFGIANDKQLPYDTNNWTESTPAAVRTCADHQKLELAQCLSAQISPRLMNLADGELTNRSHPMYNPRFAAARQEAKESLRTITPFLKRTLVSRTSEIKQRLLKGESLAMESNVYYGAWNHGGGTKLGIESDSNAFAQGMITYPEKGSVDRARSLEMPARHAVVIVGYDDNVELTYTKKMSDGKEKTFTRKGVYYFKNSWNKATFGRSFRVQGMRVPGFGVMLQDYAHEFGQFTAISVDAGADL